MIQWHSTRALPALALLALAACDLSTSPVQVIESGLAAQSEQLAFDCTASRATLQVSCSGGQRIGANRTLIGGQNVYLRLTSSNVGYDSGTEIFQFDVTVQNLLNEAIGTPDGTVADPDGIQVVFHDGPTMVTGSGGITVANADGVGTFTAANQPYFAYHQILAKDAVSAAKTWQLNMPSTVETFTFQLMVETDVQYLIVINEILVNPGGTISDASGEWIELYNAGTLRVNLQNLVIADSVASGRRAYQPIGSSLVMLPGTYATLGKTTNTTNNGGVPIDYVHTMVGFPNSLGAFKIARVVGTDTLTVDRTQFASAAISAQNGVSRELKNPALDNSNMDGSNWADALVTAVFGPGGRGTPKAQNSTFTP
jgi:hypothetical protein